MKPVDQTRFGLPGGNCFQAVLASLLELGLEDVPDFCNQGSGWQEAMNRWFVECDLFPVEFNLRETDPAVRALVKEISDKTPIEAAVNSPRGKGLHSVVWHQGRVVHDPHPSRDSMGCRLEDLKSVVVFVDLKPQEKI